MERRFNKQVKLHVKKGDMVMVIAGDDKGKKGRVLEVMNEKNRALVEGVNISNLKVIDKSGTPTRVGRKTNDAGKLVRYSKKSGEIID
jgi:large subunit ribosomal protein L24